MKEKNKEFLKILFKEVGELPKVMKIDNTLETKQDLVGGIIEVIPYEDVLLICNEDRKIFNLKPNLIFDYDYIAGNCFLIGDDYKNGGFESLTDEQIEKYKQELIKISMKKRKNNNETILESLFSNRSR